MRINAHFKNRPQRSTGRLIYIPWDVWESSPRVQLLRALYHFDWVSLDELVDVIGAPTYLEGNNYAHNKYQTQIARLVKYGLVERRRAQTLEKIGSMYEYRLKKRRKLRYPQVSL